MMNTTTAIKLFQSVKELHDHHVKMRSTAMRLFTHPDASANDVMRVQQSMTKSYVEYRRMYAMTRQATEKYLSEYRYNWELLKL